MTFFLSCKDRVYILFYSFEHFNVEHCLLCIYRGMGTPRQESPIYECMHMPRVCKYLKAAGGTIRDEETNLFHEEYLNSYREN